MYKFKNEYYKYHNLILFFILKMNRQNKYQKKSYSSIKFWLLDYKLKY